MLAYGRAARDAMNGVASPVPASANAPTRLMKELSTEGYRYAHDEEAGVAEMSSLPEHLEGRKYHEPTDRGIEGRIRTRSAGAAMRRRSGMEQRQ
jgi:putative ATPase